MDHYDQIANEFSSIPHIQEWEEVQSLFRRVALGKPKHWMLPFRACEAVGGTFEQVVPGLVAVACAHIGIVLVDDMLDADPRGEHLRVGAPAAANMASALQSAALAAITRCNLNTGTKLAVMESVNEMFLATTIGQYWDVQSIIVDEASYWRMVQAKSSPFFGAAFQIGALMGGASVDPASQIKELGKLYGEMIQIHDDINDTLASPANPDWSEGRSPLPILFARLVEHPVHARFEELCQDAATSPKSLEEAQEILIQCGAISYCVHQLLSRYQTVKGILSGLSLRRRDVMESVFEDVVMPISRLFQSMGETATLEIPADLE